MADKSEKRKAATPKSEHDWTIHAINIQGAFLEAWCRDLVGRVPGWSLAYYNYPVRWADDESELDLRADFQFDLQRVSLLIECKKNNPELTDWVFFPKRGVFTATPSPVFHLGIQVDAAGRVTVGETASRGFPWMSVVANDGRETRGNYRDYKDKNDKTRTSNRAITDASRQVSLAYRAIVREEAQHAPRMIQQLAVPYHPRLHVFVPVIVTTARLYVCDFDPKDVDPVTGELPWDKATLFEVTHLRYVYPLPPSLHWEFGPDAEKDNPDWREPYIRQWIGIVNAAYFESFLRHYAEHMKNWVHMAPFPDEPQSLGTASSAPPPEPDASDRPA